MMKGDFFFFFGSCLTEVRFSLLAEVEALQDEFDCHFFNITPVFVEAAPCVREDVVSFSLSISF